MPLNMQDPYLRAERQPAAMVALGVRLKAHFGVGADAFGTKGDASHYSGYHRSRNFLENSPQGNGGDYSTRGSKNQGGNGNNNCAWDLTPGVWGTADNHTKMIQITRNVLAAARANDPRLAAYYEFAGTLDGRTVVTFYAQGGALKDPFDKSHIEHFHASKYRSMAENDDTGLGDIILGVGGGQEEEEDMHGYGPQVMPAGQAQFTMTVPPVGGTPVVPGPAEVYCNLIQDLIPGGKAAYRIYTLFGDGSSKAVGNADGIVVVESAKVVSFPLPKGTRGISVMRWGVRTDGTPQDPRPFPDDSPHKPFVHQDAASFAFEVK